MTDLWEPHRIVVGIDGSDASIDALRWAAQLCVDKGTELDAVLCWMQPVDYGMGGYAVAAYPPEWDPSVDATHALAAAVKAVFGDELPPGLTMFVKQGHPAEVLIEVSEGADMLVVGTRGHGGFSGLLLGSVSAHCIEHAGCPVTVFRRPSTSRSGSAATTEQRRVGQA